jgi:hypothetical protein
VTDKQEIVTLKGLAITEDGKLTKSGYFEFLKVNLDDYSDLEFTPEEARKVSNHLRKLSTGSTAMTPMYCAGPTCPFAERCPLQQINKAPIGKQCLPEVQLMKEWTIRYIEEYDIDPNNFTEVAYVNELAEIEILLMRLNMNLSKAVNAELVIDQEVGATNQGAPITQKSVSPFMDLKDRLQGRRSKIIKLMVGDRQEKYKKEAALKVKLDDDPSSKMATMRTRIENLTRQLDGMSNGMQSEKDSTEGVFSPQDVINEVAKE